MFKGKALLIIDRLEANNPKEFHWDIDARVLALNQDDPGGEVGEAFNIMEWDYYPAPAAAYRMAIGDRIRVLVTFELHFSRSWEGEYDADLYLTKERVLRYQPYNERQYRRSFYKYWKSSQNS